MYSINKATPKNKGLGKSKEGEDGNGAFLLANSTATVPQYTDYNMYSSGLEYSLHDNFLNISSDGNALAQNDQSALNDALNTKTEVLALGSPGRKKSSKKNSESTENLNISIVDYCNDINNQPLSCSFSYNYNNYASTVSQQPGLKRYFSSRSAQGYHSDWGRSFYHGIVYYDNSAGNGGDANMNKTRMKMDIPASWNQPKFPQRRKKQNHVWNGKSLAFAETKKT